jgi:2-enoate reductase
MTGGLIVPRMNRYMLQDMLALNEVKIITDTRAVEITKDGVIATVNGKKKSLKADTVVLAVGLKSDNPLEPQLNGRYVKLYNIGDSREPRNIMGAIWDGYEVGRTI